MANIGCELGVDGGPLRCLLVEPAGFAGIGSRVAAPPRTVLAVGRLAAPKDP